MPSTMNHLYHTLAPLILYAAFLVSLLAFLAPTPIFADRVSLLSVTLNSTARNSSASASTKRWLPDVPDTRRMVKRAPKKAATESESNNAYEFVYGPLGACLSLAGSDLSCTSPTFTPIFVDLYSTNASSVPGSTTALLPDQFPLVPSALFVSLVLIAVQLLAVIGSSISMHASKKGKAQKLAARQPAMRKLATVCGFVGVGVLLASTISLRVQLVKVVNDVGKARVGTASLGSGFSQLFAGAALEIVVLILLVAEAFTSR